MGVMISVSENPAPATSPCLTTAESVNAAVAWLDGVADISPTPVELSATILGIDSDALFTFCVARGTELGYGSSITQCAALWVEGVLTGMYAVCGAPATTLEQPAQPGPYKQLHAQLLTQTWNESSSIPVWLQPIGAGRVARVQYRIPHVASRRLVNAWCDAVAVGMATAVSLP